MRKLILIAGMYRSGSTWLFNAVRMFLELKYGKENVYGCYITDYKREDERQFHVVKTHEYIQEIAEAADLIVLSERDFPGIAASMSKFHGIFYQAPEMAKLNEYYKEYFKYPDKSVEFEFDEITYSGISGSLGKILCMNRLIYKMLNLKIISMKASKVIRAGEIVELVQSIEKLPIPEGTPDYADPITLLHPKHRA